MATAMSLNALLSNSPTLAYHFLMLLRPAALSHFWAKLILRECVRLYAVSMSGCSSNSISARSLWLEVHFSGDTISRYLLRISNSAFVSLFLSLSGWYAALLRMGLPSASTSGYPLLIRSYIIALKSSLALATSVITSRRWPMRISCNASRQNC